MNSVGERVKWARAQRGLSQKQLAERAGVSTGMIGNLESGARDRPRELVAIARALEASVDWLDTGEGEWEERRKITSSVERMFVQEARDWDVRILHMRPQDANRLPDWLTGVWGKGRYVPDLEMFIPGREGPVWIEIKDMPMLFNSERVAQYKQLAEQHPDQYVLFQPDSRMLDQGVGALMERFGAQRKPKRAADALDDFDVPQFSRKPASAEPRAAFGMSPILAWEHADDLPDGDFVMVPRLDVHLSAGGGRDQVEIELVKDNPQAFRSEWIRLMRLKPAKLAAMRASGESMEPTIHDGDSLLVDTSQTDVVDGKVYALWYDGGERVKRLFRLPGGGLRIKSDNSAFDSIEVHAGEIEHVRVIGRVVHRSGTGGL